jgi:rubrerythrin
LRQHAIGVRGDGADELGTGCSERGAIGSQDTLVVIVQMDFGYQEAAYGREQARRKAEEAIRELERVLSSTVWSFRAHRLVQTRCICGKLIARDLEFIEAGRVVSCSACERVYNCRFDEAKGGFEFWPQQASWTCPQCKSFHSMDPFELKSPRIVECSECHEKFEVAQKIILTRVATAGLES